MLSPEAKEFVPRQFSDGSAPSGQLTDGLLGPGPAGIDHDEKGPSSNGLPSFMTTCYPFVTSGDHRYFIIHDFFVSPEKATYRDYFRQWWWCRRRCRCCRRPDFLVRSITLSL